MVPGGEDWGECEVVRGLVFLFLGKREEGEGYTLYWFVVKTWGLVGALGSVHRDGFVTALFM